MNLAPPPSRIAASDSVATLYLDLLKRTLTRYDLGNDSGAIELPPGLKRTLFEPVRRWLARRHLEVVRSVRADQNLRAEGLDWPRDAETMIGLKRLDNIQACVTDVIRSNVPGDLLEAGVWRGGATIFMRGVLAALGDTERLVWAADSFRGLPAPDAERYPADAGDPHHRIERLGVSLEDVRANFARYGLLDERVRFLEGWFKDTLPSAPIERLAVARLDGDMYESIMDSIAAVYPKLSVGGYLIVDDYVSLAGCRAAVDDFRARNGITEEIRPVDWSAAFWQRSR